MGCRNQTSRIVVKRSKVAGERATVPPNEDHKSGLWSDTDIYKGEMFFNQVDGVLQTRDDSGIVDLNTSSVNGKVLYKAHLTQTVTNPPVASVIINNTGGTVVLSYVSTGKYRATLAGAFAGNIEVQVTQPRQDGYFTAYRPKNVTDYIEIETTADEELKGEGQHYITVIKHG